MHFVFDLNNFTSIEYQRPLNVVDVNLLCYINTISMAFLTVNMP